MVGRNVMLDVDAGKTVLVLAGHADFNYNMKLMRRYRLITIDITPMSSRHNWKKKTRRQQKKD
jgi:hypothetical protein